MNRNFTFKISLNFPIKSKIILSLLPESITALDPVWYSNACAETATSISSESFNVSLIYFTIEDRFIASGSTPSSVSDFF